MERDVGAATSVPTLTDRYAGQVSSEKTQSDDDGRPTYTRMVLRVRSADLSETIDALKGPVAPADGQPSE